MREGKSANKNGVVAAMQVCALICVTVAGMGSLGCATPRTKQLATPVQPQVVASSFRFRKEYVLAAGDQIEVVVRRSPEVSRSMVIRPDGKITLPLVQDVDAAGLTPRELREKLVTLLSTRLVDPEVTVIPLQVRQPVVYVVGDVGTVVPVAFRDAPTAMQAVAIVGGFRRSANMRAVQIIRLSEEGVLQVIPIEVSDRSQPGPYIALRQAVLQPDDIVFVPENKRTQFNRFYDEILSRPMLGINQILGSYLNFRLVQEVSSSN